MTTQAIALTSPQATARSVARLLAVPLADDAVAYRLDELDDTDVLTRLTSWLTGAADIGWLTFEDLTENARRRTIRLTLTAPAAGHVQIHVRPDAKTFERIRDRDDGTVDVVIAGLDGPDEGVVDGHVVVLGRTWTAALVVERMRPLLNREGRTDAADVKVTLDAGQPFQTSWTRGEDHVASLGLSVTRSRGPAGTQVVTNQVGGYDEKVRQLEAADISEGTRMLATVFLPPVTQSLEAVLRYYRERHGSTEESLDRVRERYQGERNRFLQHVANNRQIHIIDRGVLAEYLAAPEYYQMPLTVAELRQQVENVVNLLASPNYELCLSPEAIDLSFELQSGRTTIRTDRRNKGQPRAGRVSSLTFTTRDVADVFEREFWALHRTTEERFRDKTYVTNWLIEAADTYRGP